jgi:hypothetical protein
MVHPVQRHRRGKRVSERLQGSGRKLSHSRMALVARGDAAGHFSRTTSLAQSLHQAAPGTRVSCPKPSAGVRPN